MEKNLDENYKRMLCAILNKFLKQKKKIKERKNSFMVTSLSSRKPFKYEQDILDK